MATTTKQFDIVVKYEDLVELNQEIKDLQKNTKDLSKEFEKNKEQIVKNNIEIDRKKQSLSDLKKEIKENTKAEQENIKANSYAEGSIMQLREQVKILTREYANLSAEERDNTNKGKELLQVLSDTNNKLQVLEGAYGDNRRKVGSYNEAVDRLKNSINLLQKEYDTLSDEQKQNKAIGGELITQINRQTKELDELNRKLDQINQNTANFGNQLKNTGRELLAGAGLLWGISEAASFVTSTFKDMVRVTVEMEKFSAVLANSLGSDSAAKEAMDNIVDFATKTPFQVSELTAAFTRWVNMGLKPSMSDMQKIGDVASALGAGFEQTAEAFKDLMVGQTKRLEEVGISATQSNGKIQLSFKGVNVEIEKNAEGVRKALETYGTMIGVSGSMAAQSEKLGGKISNLADNWDKLLYSMGQQTSGVMTSAIDLINDFLDSINDSFKTQKGVIDSLVEGQLRAFGIDARTDLEKYNDKLNGLINNAKLGAKITIDDYTKATAEGRLKILNMLKWDRENNIKELKKATEEGNKFEINAAKARFLENIKVLDGIKKLYKEEVSSTETKTKEQIAAEKKAAKEILKARKEIMSEIRSDAGKFLKDLGYKGEASENNNLLDKKEEPQISDIKISGMKSEISVITDLDLARQKAHENELYRGQAIKIHLQTLADFTSSIQQAEIAANEGNESKIKSIRKKYALSELILRGTSIAVDTVTAVLKALADPLPAPVRIANSIAAGAAGAAGLITLGVEKAKIMKLGRGGIIQGDSHNSPSGGVPVGNTGVMVEGNEGVINKKSMSHPILRSIASWVNEQGGGVRFADGGILPAISATGISKPQLPILNDFRGMFAGLAQEIGALKVYVVESEMRSANIKAQIFENRMRI